MSDYPTYPVHPKHLSHLLPPPAKTRLLKPRRQRRGSARGSCRRPESWRCESRGRCCLWLERRLSRGSHTRGNEALRWSSIASLGRRRPRRQTWRRICQGSWSRNGSVWLRGRGYIGETTRWRRCSTSSHAQVWGRSTHRPRGIAGGCICHSSWHDWGCGSCELGRWDLWCWYADIVLASLCCQHSLCLISVSLALAVLLIRVLYGNLLVHEVLPVHIGDC